MPRRPRQAAGMPAISAASAARRPLLMWAVVVRQVVRRVDETDVREGLREVAQLPPRRRVVLLGEQAEIVRDAEQFLEQRARFVVSLEHQQRVDEPERARQEDAFAADEAVDGVLLLCLVPLDEAVAHQLALN